MHRLATFVFAVLLALAAPARAEEFVDGIDDLPLMAGLAMVGEPAVFDAPQGRVIDVLADGTVSRAAILDFYTRTLPQLGWLARGEGQFAREGEKLVLEFPPARAGRIAVRFFLSPE